MSSRDAGFTLLELLVAMLMTSVLVAGLVQLMGWQNRRYIEQDFMLAMEQNLRTGTTSIADALRASGDGVPKTNLAAWFPWVAGFTANPRIVTGPPVGLSVARCSPRPVARLSARAAKGATSLSLASEVSGATIADLLDASTKRLIFIDDRENALVLSVSGTGVTIDTDPVTAGSQGLANSYPSGATLCRVDVLTYGTQTDPATGVPQLLVNRNQGGAPEAVALGIADLGVTTVTAGTRYQIRVTGRTERASPASGAVASRGLVSNVTVRNGP